MAKTIFVANLPFSTDETELRALFESVGSVVMEDDADYERAVEKFSGYRHRGRQLVVNEARLRETAGRS